MRIFLDANILFSAAKSAGAVRAFLFEIEANGHVLVVDPYVLAEARRNLEVKFPSKLSDLEEILSRIEVLGKTTCMLPDEVAEHLPTKDRPVLAAALHGDCTILLTGDKRHFGAYFGKTLGGVAVYSPAGLALALGKN